MTTIASSGFNSRPRLIAYWVTTALVVFELAMGGAWDLLRVAQVRGLIERLGYPIYFLAILGTWKLLGAVALAVPKFPRLKEWAYAGAFFDLTGAVASLFASGLISASTMAYPILMTAVALASWALRPPSRRLRSVEYEQQRVPTKLSHHAQHGKC
ncbi:MAG: DoxX family protein [Acidobacteriaceae bacterium]|nr:DoxX family protein [Acidobacteriaceae bacterium]